MEVRKMRAADLARKAKMSKPEVSQLLKGSHGMRLDSAIRICNALEIDLNTLVAKTKRKVYQDEILQDNKKMMKRIYGLVKQLDQTIDDYEKRWPVQEI